MTPVIVTYVLSGLFCLLSFGFTIRAITSPTGSKLIPSLISVAALMVAVLLLAIALIMNNAQNMQFTEISLPGITLPSSSPSESTPNTSPLVLPDCVKVNGSASNYEKLWLRSDGSGIYDLSSKGISSITSEYFYFLGGKNPANEDHDIFAWNPNTVVAIRGFELWNCGPIAAFTPEMVVEQLDKSARQKWENDQSNGIKHNIVIHYPDGTVKRYDNGAEVPLPASMKDMNYSACGGVTVPSWQNTPGDVLNSGQPMTSTLGQPGCGSLFIGTRNGAKVAVFWIGVDERFTYSEGNFWVLPAGYALSDAVNFTDIKQAMAELGVTTIQDRNGNTVFPK